MSNNNVKTNPLSVAKARFVRVAPRKLRLLANLIAYKNVEFAERQLRNHARRGAIPLLKALQSAKANAARNTAIPAGAPLYIKEIRVDGGRVLKRFMPRAFGRASPIRKRTSHITLILSPIAHRKAQINKRQAQSDKQII